MKKIILHPSQHGRRKSIKLFLSGMAILASVSAFAQNNAPRGKDTLSLFSNPMFNTLLGVIILLLIIISVLGGALVSVAEATREKNKAENKSGNTLGILLLLGTLASGKSALAQGIVQTADNSAYMGLSSGMFYLLITFISFELIIIIVLVNLIRLFTKRERPVAVVVKEQPSLIERLNASVAIEKEHDIMLDHNYDGIRELDNDLPPWWKYGFYLTILFAVVYLIHYHVTSTGDLQITEYNKSVLLAKAEKAEFDKNNANNVNESNATMLTDKAEIAKGESAFKESCFACHGQLGEGGVGPNLTDDYWLHGGSIKDIFRTIKYGWPDKGMKAWQADLSPVQIHEITCYIKTLRGTNPPNGKAPQGDLFIESGTKADTLQTDSVQVMKADTAAAVK